MTAHQKTREGPELGPVGNALEKAVFLKKTARCPKCAEPVTHLTNGSYACQGGPAYANAPHIYHSRSQLDGEISWWHGRLSNSIGVLLLGIYVLWKTIDERVDWL